MRDSIHKIHDHQSTNTFLAIVGDVITVNIDFFFTTVKCQVALNGGFEVTSFQGKWRND